MHVSVSANRNMTAYEEIQSEIEQAAGRINGTFGSFELAAGHADPRARFRSSICCLLPAADVCWITPLADGMNLVCKEYRGARTDGDGVLVLSEFAGAAVELSSAVITNPFSHRSMDMAIEQALAMPEEERRQRMAMMRETVKRYGIKAWAEDQMSYFTDDETLPAA
jgi:trehalose-6-phosphate synthase